MLTSQEVDRVRKYLPPQRISPVAGRTLRLMQSPEIRAAIATCILYKNHSSHGILARSLQEEIRRAFPGSAKLYELLRSSMIGLGFLKHFEIGKEDVWLIVPNETLAELLNINLDHNQQLCTSLTALQDHATHLDRLRIAEIVAKLIREQGLDGAWQIAVLALETIPQGRGWIIDGAAGYQPH